MQLTKLVGEMNFTITMNVLSIYRLMGKVIIAA